MGIAIDLTNTERRISTAEFALRMNISKRNFMPELMTVVSNRQKRWAKKLLVE